MTIIAPAGLIWQGFLRNRKHIKTFAFQKLNKLIQTKEGESHVMVQSLFDI